MEMTGIDPATYRMQSDRSTIWATSPLVTKLFHNNNRYFIIKERMNWLRHKSIH